MTIAAIKVDCIIRYNKLRGSIEPLKEFLIEEKIVSKDFFDDLPVISAVAINIVATLQRALKENTIMLADFEWTLLPKEQIRITITTDNTHKEFVIGY